MKLTHYNEEKYARSSSSIGAVAGELGVIEVSSSLFSFLIFLIFDFTSERGILSIIPFPLVHLSHHHLTF